MNKRIRFFTLLTTILIFVVACESSTSQDPDELEFAKFEGTVGTSVNSGLYEELEGRAVFKVDALDSVFSFEFYSDLISDTSETKIVLNLKSLELPIVGSYNIIDVDTTLDVRSNGFSGFYLSPTVGLNDHYYTESGSVTITSSEPTNGIKGNFEAIIFKNSEVDSAVYVRQYSKVEVEFFAAPENP